MGPLPVPHRGKALVISVMAALGLIAIAPQAALAAPVTLLDVTGTGATGQFIGLDQGAAVSFTLDKAYSNVAISADLICIGCDGEVILMQGLIGPTATLANLVTGDFFDSSSPVDPLLSGLSLGAGTYFVIVAMTDSGSAGWTGSDPFTLSTVSGVTMGLDYFASDLDSSAAFKSAFSPIASSAALHFTVTAESSSSGDGGASSGGTEVPEPAGLTLLALGPLLWRSFRRSR
jgi:hypothetical protein